MTAIITYAENQEKYTVTSVQGVVLFLTICVKCLVTRSITYYYNLEAILALVLVEAGWHQTRVPL